MRESQHTVLASDAEEKKPEERSTDSPSIKLIGEDPPEPGAIYMISQADSSQIITNDNGKIVLSNFDGNPLKSQKWVCHRSSGWLGFVNDAKETTTYLGHDPQGILICKATCQRGWEHFCVRKRSSKGFEILLRHFDGLQPLADRGNGQLGKHQVSDTWWSFTKVG